MLHSEPQITEELESHLIEMYFIWEQPWCQVVDEKLFRQSRRTGGRYFSPLLLNSILASGSRYSDRPEIRTDPNDPMTAGRAFREAAEVLLHLDMKQPTITTLQSLQILGPVYVVCLPDATLFVILAYISLVSNLGYWPRRRRLAIRGHGKPPGP